MKKKKHRPLHRHRKPSSHRNASGGSPPAPRPRSRPAPRAQPPHWKTILAALAGGAGGAALSGLIVNQKILSPEAAGVGLMLGGGATAYFADGHARVVGSSVAAAGAGQLALAVITKQAVKDDDAKKDDKHEKGTQQIPSVQTPQLAAPAAPQPPPRKSATGGGVVLDLFRDAANDLDQIEDEWRYGIRDNAGAGDVDSESDEPIVIDLDEAA